MSEKSGPLNSQLVQLEIVSCECTLPYIQGPRLEPQNWGKGWAATKIVNSEKESGERMRVGVGWYVEHMYKTCMHKNARGFLNVLWRELPTFPKF